MLRVELNIHVATTKTKFYCRPSATTAKLQLVSDSRHKSRREKSLQNTTEPSILSWSKLAGRLQLFGWWWETLQAPIGEDDWFVLIWHGVVHDWAVPVSAHQIVVSLLRLAPLRDHGLTINIGSSELLQGGEGICRVAEIHDSVSKNCHAAEISWQIQEVISLAEASIVEEIHQRRPREV